MKLNQNATVLKTMHLKMTSAGWKATLHGPYVLAAAIWLEDFTWEHPGLLQNVLPS